MLPDRIHGGSRENLLDFTIGRCYSIRMYHNVSDVYIIYSNIDSQYILKIIPFSCERQQNPVHLARETVSK